MFGRIVGGLLMAVAGAACCYYSYQLVAIFGRNAWAERNLGGTRNAIVLGGMFLIVIGILIVFGVVDITNPTEMTTSQGFVQQ